LFWVNLDRTVRVDVYPTISGTYGTIVDTGEHWELVD
jgi:hypothetical protein